MVKKNQKLPHAQAFKHAKNLISKVISISEAIQDTSLSHNDVLRIKHDENKYF